MRPRVRRSASRLVVALLACGFGATASAQRSSRETEQLASRDTSLRIVISLTERRLRVLHLDAETLLVAPVGVGSGRSLRFGAQRWTFTTPVGTRTVIAKDSAPEWVPPDWHYVEVARREGVKLLWLKSDTSFALEDGTQFVFRDGRVSIVSDAGVEEAVDRDDDLIIDGRLVVAPIGSAARRVPGQLGLYRLSLGDGIGIHGTPEPTSVGRASTHGCMRLYDADIEWLYQRVPVGTRVYIY